MSVLKSFFRVEKIKESYVELVHKVSWPAKAELSNSAVIVLVASTIIALVIAAMDLTFENIMEVVYRLLS